LGRGENSGPGFKHSSNENLALKRKEKRGRDRGKAK